MANIKSFWKKEKHKKLYTLFRASTQLFHPSFQQKPQQTSSVYRQTVTVTKGTIWKLIRELFTTAPWPSLRQSEWGMIPSLRLWLVSWNDSVHLCEPYFWYEWPECNSKPFPKPIKGLQWLFFHYIAQTLTQSVKERGRLCVCVCPTRLDSPASVWGKAC